MSRMDNICDFGNKYKSSNAVSFSFNFSSYVYLKPDFSLKAPSFVKKLYSRADGSGFFKKIRILTSKDGDKSRERECAKEPLTQKTDGRGKHTGKPRPKEVIVERKYKIV